MIRIAQPEGIGDLPVEELVAAVGRFMKPVLDRLPDKRLRAVGVLLILGILAGQSPVITHMAQGCGMVVHMSWGWRGGSIDLCLTRRRSPPPSAIWQRIDQRFIVDTVLKVKTPDEKSGQRDDPTSRCHK